MEPINDTLRNQFIAKIEQYNQEKYDLTIKGLNELITNNIDILKNVVDFSKPENMHCREKINNFAENITQNFVNNQEAQKLADEIKGYVNTAFFDTPDISKKIYSYFLPKTIYRSTDIEKSNEVQPLRNVSKSFRQNMEEAIDEWRQEEIIDLKCLKIKTADKAVEYVKKHHLRKINIIRIPNIQAEHINQLAAYNIHTLIIKCKDSISVKEWPEMKSLERLNISVEKFDDIIVSAKKFPNLKLIEVSWGEKFEKQNDQHIIDLLKAFPNLNDLRLSHSEITGDGFVGKTYPGVEWLYFNSREATDEVIEKIVKALPGLRGINIGMSRATENSIIALLKNCHNLEIINIFMNKMDGKGFKDMIPMNSKVKTINIGSTNQIGKLSLPGNTLLKLLEACPLLEDINFEATEVFWEELTGITKTFSSLKKINLNNTKIKNQSLANILKICPDLIEISLKRTQITNEEWLLNNKTFLNVEKIDLTATKMTCEGLINFLDIFPNIKEIILREIDMKGENFKHAKKNFPSVREIHVTNEELTKDAIKGFATVFPNITSIRNYYKEGEFKIFSRL